ncbi:MAG: PDDEXK nuclease domain-containing protein [Zoogloeaceae bacterium]|nr:PDDEXK nuclease domain-containing protein [Zoogloeaceae bacterium]
MNKKRVPAKTVKAAESVETTAGYAGIHDEIVTLLQAARSAAARSVNALMTATYWEIGRRIVEFEQGGKKRAEYGNTLLKRLSGDLTAHFGRGFGIYNLQQMRLFYLAWPVEKIYCTLSNKSADASILQTLSGESSCPEFSQTPSAESGTALLKLEPAHLAQAFPLPWSAYVSLLSVKNEHARAFYETEALRGGWSVRQLNRQIDSQFYERAALSRNKAAMLQKGEIAKPGDEITPEEAIKDPYVLEFLDLKDEYSESELEGALIHRRQDFLLELGSDFTFVARQRRLRIGDSWCRVDLLFFHRRLRCLVIIDLKLAKLNHTDVGQMHMYCNYAREHWTLPGENPPIGLILCARHDEAVARYALDGLPNKVLAAEYQTVLPDEKLLADELAKTRRELEARRIGRRGKSECGA